MIRTYFILITIINCIFSISFSQSKLNFDYDYAIFQSADQKLYLEFYYSFNQDELKFIKGNEGFKAGGKILMDVFSNAAGKNVVMKEFDIPINVIDTSAHDMHSKLTGQINFLFDPGTYKFNIKACDMNDITKCFEVAEEVEIKTITSAKVSSSFIELATSISKSSDVNNIFYKNTLEVTPNPSKLFGNNLAKVYYYMELYNLRTDLISDNYIVDIYLSEIEGREVKHESKKYPRNVESRVEFGAIDIKDVPSGKYDLIIKLSDDKNTEVLKTSKAIYIFNSSVTVTDDNMPDLDKKYYSSLYPQMSEKELEDEFDKSIYVMTFKSREQYGKLKDLDSKRKFMFLFWNALDPNPATPESEFKKDYFEKINFANKNFGSGFKEGWKTDRGRVYCIYGKYDEIERHAYEGSTRAYEIWGYAMIQGGVQFVFVDESTSYGDYVLVHSNARNEIFNESWREKLSVK